MIAAVFLLLAGTVRAQDEVTVREINDIADAAIAQLEAAGTDLTLGDIDDAIQSAFAGETVTFTAVVLTDPFLSGLRSVDNAGTPDEKVPIHMFVRDTAAADTGPEGQGIQIFSEEPATTGLTDVTRGDVIRITGTVSYFSGGQLQFEVESTELLGSLEDNDLPETLLDPIELNSTADVNAAIDTDEGGQVQINWANFEDLNGSCVRIENVKVLARTLTDTSNPGMLVSSDNGETYIQLDTRYSVRFNNGRIGTYPDEFLTREAGDPFVPPAVGSTIHLQGCLLYSSSGFEAFGGLGFSAEPNGAWLQLLPFFDDDIEIVSEPSIRTITIGDIEGIPGADPVPVVVTVDADAGSVAEVRLVYETSSGASGTVVLADQGDGTYTGELPALPDGDFVTVSAEVEDTEGVVFTAEDDVRYRVLVDGIDDIADIQETADGGEGDSPFAGITGDLDIEAVVMTDPAVAGFLTVQDGTDPFSGIVVELTDEVEALGLQPGDRIRITGGTIDEIRGFRFDRSGDVTGIATPTVEFIENGDPLAPVTVTTDVLQDDAIAEAHEAMLLRIENAVVMSTNADAPSGPFGEILISSDGTVENAVRVDDDSDDIDYGDDDDPATMFAVGERYDFFEGVWSHTFGNFKLEPRTMADIGVVVNTATEDGAVPEAFVLHGNFPNPFNPQTTITFELRQSTTVTLEVFDVLGRRVATLLDGPAGAGTHTAVFDAAGLPSGLYVYRLSTDAKVQTQTMTLLK